MSPIEKHLCDLLLNALLQIGFFAILAAAFSRFVERARAKQQYCFYLAMFLFCLAVPVVNTFWHTPSTLVAAKSQQQVAWKAGVSAHHSWIWQEDSYSPKQFVIPPWFGGWIVGTWGMLVLFRLGRLSWAFRRVHRLRREASVLPSVQLGVAREIIESKHRVVLLESSAIDAPVTAGILRPAILLPRKMLPTLGESELSAILAHEYGHIRRRDFPINILCELVSLPFAWHPGIRYLMSKISQTRELSCDDYAAARLGKRRSYANTLLRLASLSLHVSRGNTGALGIFDGDNLETRIMRLTEKRLSLSRASVIGLAVAMSVTYGSGAVVAHAISLQASAKPSSAAEQFVGTWHWMFGRKSFATMILARSGAGFTGSVTRSRIMLNHDGGLLRADPSEDSTPKPITKSRLEGSALQVVADDFEFIVTIKDDKHAEIHPKEAPPKMKPIPAEKIN
jgi:beta-lactamase regulating signal transducer with metallopeptidase domain